MSAPPAVSQASDQTAPEKPRGPVDASDTFAVARALQQRLEAIPSLAWADHLRLRGIDHEVARFEPKPGQRSVTQFANERQRARLAEEVQQVIGRRVRVEVVLPAEEDPETTPAAGDAASEGMSQRAAPLTGADRRAVLDLPLVRDILEVFPDATLVDARTSASDPASWSSEDPAS